MTNTTTAAPVPKRHKLLRVLVLLVIIFLVLIVLAYLVATSAGFFKSVILPRVGKAINSQVTVSDASIHPFSAVTLRDLKVTPNGQETLLTAPELRARYSLMAILRGNLKVEEILISAPVIHLVENPDGSSNLDPITKSQAQAEKAPQPTKPAEKASKPPQVDIRKLAIVNATVRKEKVYAGGQRDVLEISNGNVTLTGLKNGESGKLVLGASLAVQNNPPAPGTNGVLHATVTGEYVFALSPELKPVSVKGGTQLAVARAEGSFQELAALSANLVADVAPTEITQLALRFQKAGEPLGELRANGPFNAEKSEGRLTVELLSLDKRVLNLIGAGSGLDFGTTQISSTNTLQFANSGQIITAAGRLDADKVQVIREKQSTPTLDLRAAYEMTLDRASSNAVLRLLTLNGTQNGNPLLRGELTSPMHLAWGNPNNAVGDSALKLTVTNLNLADWKALIGNTASGTVGLNANLLSQQGGKQLTFDLAAQVAKLTTQVGSNQVTDANINLLVRGQAVDLKQFSLTEYKLDVAKRDQSALNISGSGTYNTESAVADLQLALRSSMPRLLELAPQPNISASSGGLNLDAHLIQKNNSQAVTGDFTFKDFSAQIGSNRFQNFTMAAKMDVNKTAELVELRNISGTLNENGKLGGSFDLTGSYGLSNGVARLTAKLADFNQNGLRPFLEPLLAGKKLVTVAINGDASVNYDPSASSQIKAALQMTNLVVNDPQQQTPATALEAKLNLDTALQKKVLDLHQLQITLTPTERARNQLQLQGRVDMSNTNAMEGSLKLAAESLDITTYYDLFAGKDEAASAEAKPASGAAAPASAPSKPEEEPAAQMLPFRNFVAAINIGQLYLREVAVTNLQTTVKLDGGHVLMKPFQLSVNGAPVNAMADVDLSVPGYRYAIQFSADQIPVAPLANSFAPDYRGRAQGSLIARMDLKGAGTTGLSMQKNLNGQVNLSFTNANIQLTGRKVRLILVPIVTALRLPELADSPVNLILADIKIGNGTIDLSEVRAVGSAFAASSQGTIAIAPVLTNSPINKLPVNFALSRNLAARAGFKGSSDTNNPYVDLGAIAHVSGTIGDPKTKPDYARIALLTGEQFIGGTAGQVLRGIGATTTGTNGVGNLIQGLGGILGGGQPTSTNAPGATNAPATNAPAQSPINELLNIFGPKTKK